MFVRSILARAFFVLSLAMAAFATTINTWERTVLDCSRSASSRRLAQRDYFAA